MRKLDKEISVTENFDIRESDPYLLFDDDVVGAHLEELGDVEQHRHDRQREQIISGKERFRVKCFTFV